MKKLRKTLNNKGFSMLELLVAIGIMSVVVVTVGILMTTSSNTFSRVSVDSQLQSEAQLVANAITNMAMDSISANSVSAENPAITLDADVDVSDGNCLVLSNSVNNSTGTEKYVIARNTVKNQLYYYEVSPSGTLSSYSLLGEHIKGFSVDTSRVDADNIITFTLEYMKNGKEYVGDYQVFMRNRKYTIAGGPTSAPADTVLKGLTLLPTEAYIDFKNEAEVYNTDVENGAKYVKRLDNISQKKAVGFVDEGRTDDHNGKVHLIATTIYSGNATDAQKSCDWSIAGTGVDNDIFNLSSTAGKEIDLKIGETASKKFQDLTAYNFDVVATKEVFSKRCRVKVRMIKSLDLEVTNGVQMWNDDWLNEPYSATKAKKVPDSNYALPATSVSLFANMAGANVPDGLTWELYYAQAVDDSDPRTSSTWRTCPATIASLTSTSTSGYTNTLRIGAADVVKNLQFRIVCKSVFDDKCAAEAFVGVVPPVIKTGQGFFSRGYWVDMNSLTSEMWRTQLVTQLNDVSFKLTGNTFEDAKVLTKVEGGHFYVYLDYEGGMYSGTNKNTFYSKLGVGEFTFNNQLKGNPSGVGCAVTENIAPDPKTTSMKYYIFPVNTKKVAPSGDIVVAKKGTNFALNVQTEYYNLIKQSYFGIYVQDPDNSGWITENLNKAGSEDTNQFLTVKTESSYGDSQTYVDQMSTRVMVKDIKEYSPDPITVRLTADDYYVTSMQVNNGVPQASARADGYPGELRFIDRSAAPQELESIYMMNSSQKQSKIADTPGKVYPQKTPPDAVYTSSYVDYTVYICNVDREDAYLPTPDTTLAQTELCKWPTNVPSFNNDNDGKDKGLTVTGYALDKSTITGKVWKNGSKYKLLYKGSVYTYNKANCYWTK